MIRSQAIALDCTADYVEMRLRQAIALKAPLPGSDLAPVPEGIGTIGGIGVAAGDVVVADAVEALSWLQWLESVDADLLLARLEGASWKSICWRFGVSRPTADRRYRYGLSVIAWRLKGHRECQAPSLRSMMKADAA